MKLLTALLIAVSFIGWHAVQAQEQQYEGPIYNGTNWWVQETTTVWGTSGTGEEQYDLPRGYGVYIDTGPVYNDGIWWFYADKWGWIRAEDLGYDKYIPPQTTTQAPRQATAQQPGKIGRAHV